MKKLRVIFLISIIILLSGCTGSYNLKINDDFTIAEKLNVVIDNDTEDTYKKVKQVFDNNNISNKKYKISATDEIITIEYKEEYSSIEEYLLNNNLYKQLIDDINYTYSDGILTLNANSKMLLEDSGSDYLYNNYDISSFQINVESPFKVKKSNSNIQNDNVLSWTLNKDTKSEDIYVEYDVEKSRSKFKDILIISLIAVILIGTITFLIINYNNSKKI